MTMFFLSFSLIPFAFLSIVFLALLTILIIKAQARYTRVPKEQGDLQLLQKLQEREKAFNATTELNTIILQTLDFDLVVKRIANAIPHFLGYETGVLALVDETRGVLKRVAISDTSGGAAALTSLEIPFSTIEIGLDEIENYCIKALVEHRTLSTTNLYDVLRPAISPQNSAIVQEMMRTKTTLIFPLFASDKRPLGTFLVSMNKSAEQISAYEYETISHFVDGIRIAIANALLYTSSVKTAEDLKMANQKLQELDHVKDEFLAYASHELRTPLTAVRGYAQLLQKELAGKLTEKQQNSLHVIDESSGRVIKLVGSMLDVSRIQAGRFEILPIPTDLVSLVQASLMEVTPTAQEHQVPITVHIPTTPLPLVLADTDKIKEVLINLLGNAVKFTPAGGSITISFTQQNGMVTTTVKDTGKGVKAEDRQYLFQEYGMIKKNYLVLQEHQGTGLGLYISRSIVRLHGGDITLSSAGENKGTSVSFSLKVAEDAALQ